VRYETGKRPRINGKSLEFWHKLFLIYISSTMTRDMVNSDRLIGDVVGVIIEKILMENSVISHSKMVEILGNYNMTFSDCYKKPNILNYALKNIFGNAYLSIAEKIRNELIIGLGEDHRINEFIEIIMEK